MNSLKTKQDVMQDKIKEAKRLLRHALFYSAKGKVASNNDLQKIKLQIMIERISDILANVYYEAILDIEKAGFSGEALDKQKRKMNYLLKVLLSNALTTKNGVSFSNQILKHYEDNPDELTKIAGLTLLALPDSQGDAISKANFHAEDIEHVCSNALEIIDEYHKKFMEDDIMPYVTKNCGTMESGTLSLDLLLKIPNITINIDGIKTLLITAELMYCAHKDEYDPILARYKEIDSTPGRK